MHSSAVAQGQALVPDFVVPMSHLKLFLRGRKSRGRNTEQATLGSMTEPAECNSRVEDCCAEDKANIQ